jgi:hypothetical protein
MNIVKSISRRWRKAAVASLPLAGRKGVTVAVPAIHCIAVAVAMLARGDRDISGWTGQQRNERPHVDPGFSQT